MPDSLDKRDRAILFRDRLAQAMAARGVNQSRLARAAGVASLTRHFDGLIREAAVGARELPAHLAELRAGVR